MINDSADNAREVEMPAAMVVATAATKGGDDDGATTSAVGASGNMTHNLLPSPTIITMDASRSANNYLQQRPCLLSVHSFGDVG